MPSSESSPFNSAGPLCFLSYPCPFHHGFRPTFFVSTSKPHRRWKSHRPRICFTTPCAIDRDTSSVSDTTNRSSTPSFLPQSSYTYAYKRQKFPPGKLPLALELDFLLSHPVTDGIITSLVLLNCFAFAMQTIDLSPIWLNLFRQYDNNISIIFLIEYLSRCYSKGLSPRFLFTRRMLVDIVALFPIFFAIADQSEVLFVRMLRLTRIFRLERLMMDSDKAEKFTDGMTFVQIQLASIALSLFSLLYVSAGLFYQVEKDINPQITNFFDAFYFSTITLFTVGFGDVTPLTTWGRIITVLTVLSGAILIPFKLSAVEKVGQFSVRRKQRPQDGRLSSPFTTETPLFNIDIECPQCHLQGHQIDARFCRNCGRLLQRRRFD